ncbi:hypothetical protein [uncultured Aquimarina sp.]|uniref:hypothetical protein n=1 Tax=uncultured Aquimarina sp. TaxID=575652 RepID=UPI0026388AC3|nr:hypothetical protein [uncultured Aquimarina sp.]
MRKMLVVLFVLGLMQSVQAQFIEVLDTNENLKTDVKSDFVWIQTNEINQVMKGIEVAGIKENEIKQRLKSKPISLIMYWRYDLVSDDRLDKNQLAGVDSYTSEYEMTDLGKKLVTLGLINTIIE